MQIVRLPAADRLFDLSPEPACLLDGRGRFLRVNAAWRKTLGGAGDSLRDRSLLESVHPEDRRAAAAALANAVRGAPALFEVRFRCRAGILRRLICDAVSPPGEDLVYMVAHVLAGRTRASVRREAEDRLRRRRQGQAVRADIADVPALIQELEIHQIELEMQNEWLQQARGEAEARMRDFSELYDFAPVGYATLDPSGAIRRINLAGADMLGTQRAALAGRRLQACVAPAYRPVLEAFLREVFHGEAEQACEVEGLEPEPGAGARVIKLIAGPRRGTEECRAAMVDVTVLKRAEKETEDALRLRTDLISLINHEFANLLTNMKLALSIMKFSETDHPDPARGRSYEVLERAIQSLTAYTANFLNLHRLETGRFELHVEPTAVRAVVLDAVVTLRPLAEAKRQRIDIAASFLEGPPVAVRADRDCLAVIVGNLLSNAIKFTPEAGAITIRLVREEGPPAQVLVSVEDTGIGIEAKNLERIKDGFFRTEAGREAAKGFGVGLMVVNQMLLRHGSRLDIASQPGQGSKFSFRLPVWEIEAKTPSG
ncbi:MAG: ATP-binding protein [Elusimicrobia bacterium]|nr:ATP-binding protein [Elusimicrobiota bacterium]